MRMACAPSCASSTVARHSSPQCNHKGTRWLCLPNSLSSAGRCLLTRHPRPGHGIRRPGRWLHLGQRGSCSGEVRGQSSCSHCAPSLVTAGADEDHYAWLNTTQQRVSQGHRGFSIVRRRQGGRDAAISTAATALIVCFRNGECLTNIAVTCFGSYQPQRHHDRGCP